MNRFAFIRDKPYESQVILLISLLGCFRLAIAVVIDLLRKPYHPAELITDLCLLLLFSGLMAMALLKARVTTIHPLFGFLFTILLALNFLEFDGIFGFARLNYLLGFFILGLLYSGRWLIIHMSVHASVALVISSLGVYWPELVAFFHLGINLDPTDYFFAIVAAAALTFYLKGITQSEIEKNEKIQQQLQENVSTATHVNALLIAQGHELQSAQQHLEREVTRRTLTLKRQEEAIQKYVGVHRSVLEDPMRVLDRELKSLPNSSLTSMAQASMYELQSVFENIRMTLEAEEQLNRNKIKK